MRTKGADGAKTEQRILDASLALFARRGYGAVSMRMIGAGAGLKASAIYNYFPSKQDILARLMSGHMEALLAAWRKADPGGAGPQRRLDAFSRFHLRYNMDRPQEVFISYMELRSLEPANFRKIEALRKKYESIPRALLDEGRRAGMFRIEDAHVGAMAVISCLTGAGAWFKKGGRLSLKNIEDYYTNMVMRGVGCGTEERRV